MEHHWAAWRTADIVKKDSQSSACILWSVKRGTGFRSSIVASFSSASLQKNTAKIISHLAELLEVRGLG